MNIRKSSHIISLLLLVALFVANVVSLRAQTAAELIEAQQDNMTAYGATPEEGEEGAPDGRPPRDSTKKRVKLPLESYFFDDSIRSLKNFKWNVNPDFNEVTILKIDTTLDNWHIDYPFYKEGVGEMTLGGLGQATQDVSFYERDIFYDFSSLQPFDAYIFTMENAPFYNTKKPFTLFNYLEAGQKSYRESNFEITHAQNIKPSTGFTIDYKSRSTKGQYDRQDTKNHNLATTFSHTGKRYSLHAGYLNNTIKTEESGGVVGLWTIRDSLFEMPIGVPMKLGDAEASNHYRNNTIFVEQSYGIPLQPLDDDDFSMADKTAFYVGHSVEYSMLNRVYSDIKASYTNDRAGVDADGNYYSEEDYYYDNWYLNPSITRDSIRERVLSNRLFVQAQPWGRDAVVSTVNGGIGLDLNAYSQLSMDSYLSGELEKDTRVSWFVQGSAEGRFRRYLKWRGDVKIFPSGYRAGDMEVGGDLSMSLFIRNKPITLSGNFSMERRSPSYWQENLVSNHYIFTSPLNTETDTRFNVNLSIPDNNFELGFRVSMVDNMIYYDTDSNITQTSDVVTVSEAYGRKLFKIGGLHLDHRISYQISSNQYAAPLPDFSAFLSYYYEFWVTKNVLRLQLGIDGRYTSKYYMPDYNPSLSTFFNQHEAEIGGYPYMDAFVAGKWKRMRILVKYQHANMGLFGNDEYFAVANYPLNPSLFKIGFSWGFYD